MAQIQDSVSPATAARVDANLGLRSSIVGATGVQLAVANGAQPNAVESLVVAGLSDKQVLPLRVDRIGSLASAQHAPLFSDSFEGATLSPMRWLTLATTQALTQSTAAGLTLNSGSLTTVNTGIAVTTARKFRKIPREPLHFRARARLIPQTNSSLDLGLSDLASSQVAITGGAYFQITTAGQLQGVLTFNGVDTTITFANQYSNAALVASNFYMFDILVDDDEVKFTIQDSATGSVIETKSIMLPLTGPRLWSSSAVSATLRTFVGATPPSAASQVICTDAWVGTLDSAINRSAADLAAASERGGLTNPLTGVSLANYTNSAAVATTATATNTTAGYTTLGGMWQIAAPLGAATDLVLFGIQVPIPSNFMVRAIDIETLNLGAAVATTPTILQWGVGVSPSVSAAATIERQLLGFQQFAIGAAIGAQAARLSKVFTAPIHVTSGRFLLLLLRVPVGTATASQLLSGSVTIEGTFE